MNDWILGLGDPGATLETAGGKGLNLVRLTRAGFAVPAGVVITTDAYRRFVAEHGLEAAIRAALAAADLDDPASAETASAAIRVAFRQAEIPAELADRIDTAYAQLAAGLGVDEVPVAVRSSATAEDLPDLSFAGQQDTFLDVRGPQRVRNAVRECWSSLWTARAIVYRRRNGVPDDAAAVAVVVQALVPAEVSGVLFTANPLTGHRGQMVMDATFGLGEALVSGQVEPDHVVADAATGRVLSRATGSKGGRPEQALDDAQVAALVALGRRIEAEYAAPQDIEWAWQAGKLHVLQSRAITSLYPVPDRAEPGSTWLSFGAVQGMLEPMTPLGRDVIRCVMAGGGRLFGSSPDYTHTPLIGEAAERLWIRADLAWRNPLGHRLVPAFLSMVEPSAGVAMGQLESEGALPLLPRRVMRRVGPRLARFVGRAAHNIPRIVHNPEPVREDLDQAVTAYLAETRERFAVASRPTDPAARAAAQAAALREGLYDGFPTLVPYAGVMIGLPIFALRMLSRRVYGAGAAGHGVSPVALELTRSLPHNVTTEMDLGLWQVAQRIAADEPSLALLRSTTPGELARAYAAGTLPAVAADAVEAFLAAYGSRGVGEIDFGRPRWREDPTDLLATVVSYLAIPADQAPPAAFARGALEAQRAVGQIAADARRGPLGPVRARLARGVASRIRALAGSRETPKFTIVQALGIAREALLATGAELAAAGTIERADDLMFLRLAELLDLPRGTGTPEGAAATRALIAARRAAYAAEARRPRVPALLAADGRAFYSGFSAAADAEGALTGSPVSPGTVEGVVRVVFDPAAAGLQHGEILVCPGTDPAWTPLFLAAGGLVTEVGGMMTHGSVVAREYGIPAVVGVHEATTRLRTGQRIRLDGSAGTILLLDETPADVPADA